MELSKTERLILINQYRILEKLCPDEAEDFSNYITALSNGFSRNYDCLFQGIDDETSPEIQQEVVDILNMHRELLCCYKDLKDRSGVSDADLRFRGFDGNYEGSHYSYAKYLIKDLGKFEESDPGKNESVNSHETTLPRYRSMLRKWKAIGNKSLAKADLLEIIST